MKFHAKSRLNPPRKAQPPSFSSKEFRSALGMFATGVTIVTGRKPGGEPVGV
ncbi:MAG TPA: flavin reductase family protein, partial [Anaerolineae bacterium]|nr:flavin reductase family protein [Anaerolineae bacterium]